ncbi:MAG TPA: hypothetical protein VJ550_07115 [Geomonas sp.]|nr:hypothetical protein [Geomonas sp.]
MATQTIKWQPDSSGFSQFMTNDTQYYGYGLWYYYTPSYEAQTSTVTAAVMKKSGANNVGYGVIFCYQDTNNFYRVMVDVIGHYTVLSRVAGTTSVIIPWSAPHTAIINTGYNVANVITVTQQSLNNFTVSFNGVQETQFTDPNFTGGYAGFYTSVSSTAENFPAVSEDVRCKLTSPVTYPVLVTTGLQAAPAQPGLNSLGSQEFGNVSDTLGQ